MSSGSSASGKVRNVFIDTPRVLRLADKILVLLGRKGHKHPSHDEAISEYWALRVAVLFYEEVLSFNFDNEAETVEFFRSLIRKGLPSGGHSVGQI